MEMDPVPTAPPPVEQPAARPSAAKQGGVMSARVQRSTTLDDAHPAVEATAVALPQNVGSSDDVAPSREGGHSLLDALDPYLQPRPEQSPNGGGQGSPRPGYAPAIDGDGFSSLDGDYGPPPEERPRQPLAINGHLFTPTADGRALRTEDGHVLELDGDAVELPSSPSAGHRSGGASPGGLSGYADGGDNYVDYAMPGGDEAAPKMKVQLKSGRDGADVLVVDGASMTLGDMRPTSTSGARKKSPSGGGDGASFLSGGGGASSPVGGRGAAAVPGGDDGPPGTGSTGVNGGSGSGKGPSASVFQNAARRADGWSSWALGIAAAAVLLAVL
jgi:hypothetical protein